MGPSVFKTDEGAKVPWRVRFPSASAEMPTARRRWLERFVAPSPSFRHQRWFVGFDGPFVPGGAVAVRHTVHVCKEARPNTRVSHLMPF